MSDLNDISDLDDVSDVSLSFAGAGATTGEQTGKSRDASITVICMHFCPYQSGVCISIFVFVSVYSWL